MGSKNHSSLTSQAGHGSSVAQAAHDLSSHSTALQPQQQAHQSKKKKLKSEKSAFRNKDKGGWSCRHCGWEYPNPQPSAKERREHRRHCSSFQSAHHKVHDWLQKSPAGELEERGSDEPERYEDGLLHVEEATARQEGTSESAMVVGNSDRGGTGIEVGPQKDKQLTTEVDGEEYVGDLEEGAIENGGTEEHFQGSEVEAKHPEDDDAGDSSQDPVQEENQENGNQILDKPLTDNLQKDEEQEVYDPHEKRSVASSDNGNQQVNPEDADEYRGRKHDGSVSEEQAQENEEKSSSQQKSLEGKDGSPTEQLQDFQEKTGVSLSQENVEDGVQKKAYYPQEKGLATLGDKGKDSVTLARSGHGAEYQLEPEVGQSVKQRIEYVEPKNTASSSEIKPLAENPFDYDLQKALREQRAYDLVCPNCHACITRRVILRKRKRTAPPVVESKETEQQQKQPKREDEPLAVSTGGEGSQQEEPREVEIETEEWQCLACFSVFFTKVRGIRLPKLGGLKETKLEVTEASTTEDGCSLIPFLLPDYAWDGDGTQVPRQPPVAQTGPSCLPLKFPWSTEGSTTVEQNEASTRSEDVRNCIPFLLPNYAWDGDGRATSQDSAVGQQRPVDQSVSSCLPLKLPWSSEEPTAVVENQGEAEIQDIEIYIDLRARKPRETKKLWIEKYLTSPSEVPSAPSRPDTSAQVPPTTDVGQAHPPTEAEDSSSPEEDRPDFINCAPILLPAYWNGGEEGEDDKERVSCLPGVFPHYYGSFQARGDAQVAIGAPDSAQGVENPAEVSADESITQPVEPAESASEQKDRSSCNCIPVVLPFYGWDSAKAAKKQTEVSMEQNTETKETVEKDNQCLPIAVPWGGFKAEPELDIEAAGSEKRYMTKETRIKGFISTITNLITVRQQTGGQPAVVDSVQVGTETAYVDMKLNKRPEAVGGNTTEVLTTAPSTGWAMLDAMENEDAKPLIDSRRPKQQEASLSEITEEDTQQDEGTSTVDDDLTKPLLPHTQQQVGMDTLLAIAQNQAEQHQRKPLPTEEIPTSTNVYVTGPGPGVLHVQGDDTNETVDTAVSIAEDIGLIPAQPEAGDQGLEILKSIVYGGVDVSLASLAVVASGAGSDVKTLNLLAMGLANIIAGLIALLHTIGSLWLNDARAFEEKIGRSFWINGGISVVSFLVFGFIAPLTYALSFRSSGDKDYKFATAAAASLVCIFLLAIAKARVQSRSYRSTIANLVLTSFVAAVCGFFVGDFLKRWLHKLGFDIGDDAAAPPTAPPPPFPFADI